jgi:rare lipoprotein A
MSRIAQYTNRPIRFSLAAAAVTAALLCSTAARHHSAPANAASHSSLQRAQAQTPAVPLARTSSLRHSEGRRHWYEFGRASWYGSGFQGQPTASGEDYDMNAMTCAHPYLPLGALVRVTNLRNRRSVVVRVNDRGPVVESRIVDLSWRAARLLGFSQRGTASVRIDLLDPRPSRSEVANLTYPSAR